MHIILYKGTLKVNDFFNAWNRKKNRDKTIIERVSGPDAEREFNAPLKATQSLPTFGRQELGAESNIPNCSQCVYSTQFMKFVGNINIFNLF